jgi:hypothetical protein
MCATQFRAKEHMSNNSFKPTPLRSGKTLAMKACQRFSSATPCGLTQALDDNGQASIACAGSPDPAAIRTSPKTILTGKQGIFRID